MILVSEYNWLQCSMFPRASGTGAGRPPSLRCPGEFTRVMHVHHPEEACIDVSGASSVARFSTDDHGGFEVDLA